MDNAAKALIMAASIILGVLLLSTFVYVFRAGASVDQSYEEAQAERELRLASAKFDIYDRQDNTITDILSVINLAYNTNEDFSYDQAKAVEVIIRTGNKFFAIPRIEPSGELRKEFGRNKILSRMSANEVDGTVQSSYDLVDKTLAELGISGISGQSDSDKLSTTRLGRVKILNPDGTEKVDEYGEPVYRNNVTIYKYLFKSKCVCGDSSHSEYTGFSYNVTPGINRIVKIEFDAELNPNWN